ncbi:hypothetical protein C8Q79DRAFT_1005954 [Trametes meyenii]|nr:hypothetical protein C8Q79DRAFT_1005954 [Trametes meyenii]
MVNESTQPPASPSADGGTLPPPSPDDPHDCSMAVSCEPEAQAEHAPEPSAPNRLARVQVVSPRDLSQIRSSSELVAAIFDSIEASKEVYEKIDGELHGDINPNSLVIIDRTDPESGERSSRGGLIYWEPPISMQTLRKVGNPDRPVPPPRPRNTYYYQAPPPFFLNGQPFW